MTDRMSGTFDESAHLLPVRVYWEDTDAGGIVYHASYIRFMERGRTETLRSLGLVQSDLRARSGLRFVVSSMEINFRMPAFVDDLLIIRTECMKIGAASLSLGQTVLRDSQCLVSAKVLCAAIDEEGRPMRFPQEVKRSLEAMQEGDI